MRRTVPLSPSLPPLVRAFAFFSVIVLHAGPVGSQEPHVRALTLSEAVELAVRKSESLGARREAAAEARAATRDLLSEVLPRFTLNGTVQVQEEGTGNSDVARTLTERTREEAWAAVEQPIFSGFRDRKAYQALKSVAAARDLETTDEEIRVRLRAAEAFLDVLFRQKELDTRRAVARVSRERVSELESRAKLGRSRRSELLAARAQLARLEAQIFAAEGREKASQERLRALTGLTDRLRLTAPPARALPDGVSLEASLQERPDVAALRRLVEAARLSVSVAARERFPDIDVTGRYFLKREGVQEDIHWDALFQAEMPVWDSGGITARTRVARARLRAAELLYAEALSEAEYELGAARADHAALERSLGALEEAVAASERNVRAQSEDYRLGVVDNLNVLDSLTSHQETRLLRDETDVDVQRARLRVLAAAGLLRSPDDLGPETEAP